MIYRYKDLRIAGYDDPFERLASQDFRDRYDATPDTVQQDLFWAWLQPLIGKVDIVMVHEPELIKTALECPQRRTAGAAARVHGRPHAQGRPGHAARRDRHQRRQHRRRAAPAT